MVEHEKAVPAALTGSCNGDSSSVGRAAAGSTLGQVLTKGTLGFVNIYSKFCNLIHLQKMRFSFS